MNHLRASVPAFILFSLLAPAFLAGCASVGDLQKSETCQVWVPGPIGGTRHAEVKDGVATVVGGCKLYCILGKYKGTVFYREKGEIAGKTNAIISLPMDSALARFEKSTLKMEPAIGKSPPVVIGAKPPLTVALTVAGIEHDQVFNWNERCTPTEVALGITGLFSFSSMGY